MVKVFYHGDPDGFCAGYWVRKHLEKEGIPFKAEDFIEMNYDKPFPMNKIQSGEKVFMVDFCLSDPDDMMALAASTDFTWIDHHKTAIEKMGTLFDSKPGSNCKPVMGIRYDGIAACALTWAYFNRPDSFMADDVFNDLPRFTYFVHFWDTWQWKAESEKDQFIIESFITYLMSQNCNPLSDIWEKLNGKIEELYTMANNGSYMLAYRDGYGKACCESMGKIIDFEGYRCFVCNMPKCNSEWFKSVDSTTYDIMVPFYYSMQSNQFIVSLYTADPSIDVSAIAKKHGGGGHFSAAGFQSRDFPFQESK